MARHPRTANKPKSINDAAVNPSTPSLFYKGMATLWTQISATLEGTHAMRAAGKSYLPQHEGESDPRYQDRLQTAVFTNYTDITLDYWVGKPFSKPVQFTKDSDPEVAALADDIDLCGDDITVVCKDWFSKGLAKRVAYCFVDFPEAVPGVGGSVSLADQQAQNLRPYWVILPAESVISARKERINGEDQFTHLRYYDNETVYNGYEESVRARIREYNRIETQNIDTGVKSSFVVTKTHTEIEKDTWKTSDEREISLKVIPLAEFDVGKLKLLGLSDLNITHWQSDSDQRNCLTTARFPILAAKGVDENTAVTIGPYSFLASKDPNSLYYYVEHQGFALNAGEVDLTGLEDRMALYGAEALKQAPDRQTATAAVIDTAQTTAPLQLDVFSFKSSVQQAVYFMLLWMDKDPEKTVANVEINTDFALSQEQSAQVDNLKDLRAKGDISREQFLQGMIDAKAISPDFDIKKNDTQLLAEQNAKADQAADAAKKLALAAPPKPAQPVVPPRR